MKDSFFALDTNIFIYYYEQHPEFGPAAEKILSYLQTNKSRGVTSIVTLTELLSIVTSDERVTYLKEHFLRSPNLMIIDVDQQIALEAGRIRREYHFRTSDALQLATALVAKADMFITNDKRLQGFKEIKISFLKPNS